MFQIFYGVDSNLRPPLRAEVFLYKKEPPHKSAAASKKVYHAVDHALDSI